MAYDDAGRLISLTHGSSAISSGENWGGTSTLPSSLGSSDMLAAYTFQYDTDNRVTQKIEYVYDAFDNRVGKRLDSDGDGDFDRDEAFVWTEGQTVLRAVDSDGEAASETFTLSSRYLYGEMVDQLLADDQYDDGAGPEISTTTAAATSGETFWALTDHLGSVRDLVDNNGEIRQHVAYDSFGNRIVEQDYDASGTAISSSHPDAIDELFGYTGRDWDADTGLQNNRARWYDPATDRWLSQAPKGLEPDSNPYRYVRNQPTTLTDPSGLEPPVTDAGPVPVDRGGLPVSGGTIRLMRRTWWGGWVEQDNAYKQRQMEIREVRELERYKARQAQALIDARRRLVQFPTKINCGGSNPDLTVTMYVRQPEQGNRNNYMAIGWEYGHATIAISDGNITVTKGYYPGDMLGSLDRVPVAGVVQDDRAALAKKGFDAKIVVQLQSPNVTLAEIDNYMEAYKNGQYDLDDRACGDFVIDTARFAGIPVPAAFGTLTVTRGGKSKTFVAPSAMGEDLILIGGSRP
tara:strand:+ start:6891 stop:8444 length:1554 start_codon:yes stop_codon:yes gene_type:complete